MQACAAWTLSKESNICWLKSSNVTRESVPKPRALISGYFVAAQSLQRGVADAGASEVAAHSQEDARRALPREPHLDPNLKLDDPKPRLEDSLKEAASYEASANTTSMSAAANNTSDV